MKSILINIILIMMFFNAKSQSQSFVQVGNDEFQKLAESGIGTLLDVRTESEYKAEHLKDAGQLNYYALDFRKKIARLPKDQPVYLYCTSGYRSGKAAEILAGLGYQHVYNLEHGIMGWNLEDKPVVKGTSIDQVTENKLSVNEFTEMIKGNEFVFIDFYAPWCGPCRQMMPMIDSLHTEYSSKVFITKVNSDVSKKLVKNQNLMGVPYFQFYKSGELIFKKAGLISRHEIVALFEEQLNKQ